MGIVANCQQLSGYPSFCFGFWMRVKLWFHETSTQKSKDSYMLFLKSWCSALNLDNCQLNIKPVRETYKCAGIFWQTMERWNGISYIPMGLAWFLSYSSKNLNENEVWFYTSSLFEPGWSHHFVLHVWHCLRSLVVNLNIKRLKIYSAVCTCRIHI